MSFEQKGKIFEKAVKKCNFMLYKQKLIMAERLN